MSPRDRYLDPLFHKESTEIPENRKADAKKAFKLLEEGIRLYKKKKDDAAIAKYEEALESFAAPQIYYHYANSLSNVDQLLYSVRAYEYAIENGFESPELAWFNMACALSRLEKKDRAFEALKKAILAGYPSIENLQTDGDLVFLRRDPRWNAQYKELAELYERGNQMLPAGKRLRFGMADTVNVYSLCQDGRAIVEKTISDLKNHKQFGIWNFENYKLTIQWNKLTGEKGVGDPVACSVSCEYKQYKPFSAAVRETETIRWLDVETAPAWRKDTAAACN